MRMIWVALRIAWPDLLAPWRSPFLRWRMETYGITNASGRLLHAEELTAGDMFRFLLMRRQALARFLRWAAAL